MKKLNFLKGRFGESLAEKYLKKQGYKILGKNYKTNFAETDIIAEKNKILVFVEVKARKDLDYGMPSEAVNSDKIHRLRKNAEVFLAFYDKNFEGVRFDIIEVILTTQTINHIKNAF